MSWRKTRVYKCAICGIEKAANDDYALPSGWQGSDKRYGDCLCGYCYKDILYVRMQREKVDA